MNIDVPVATQAASFSSSIGMSGLVMSFERTGRVDRA